MIIHIYVYMNINLVLDICQVHQPTKETLEQTILSDVIQELKKRGKLLEKSTQFSHNEGSY